MASHIPEKLKDACASIYDQLYNNLEIRFETWESEQCFIQSLEPEVLRNGLLVVLCTMAFIPISIIPVVTKELNLSNSDRAFRMQSDDPRTSVVIVWIVMFVFGLIYSFLNVMMMWRGWFSRLDWEKSFVFYTTVYGLCLSMGNFWHLPLLQRKDPRQVWSHDATGTDIFILLAMACLFSAITMYVPIRFCLLWILHFFAVGSYVILAIVLPACFPEDRHVTISAIVALSFFSYHGCFRSEKIKREKWLALQMVVEAEEIVKDQENTIQESAQLVKGLRTVADALCDIIVKLNSDLRVQGSEVQHDAFFECHMEGRVFTEILTEGDRQRFLSLVKEASKATIPVCMPTTIKKKSMSTEAHILLVDTGRREPRYLLGLRVEADHYFPTDPAKEVNHGHIIPGFAALIPEPKYSAKPGEVDEDDSDFSFRTYPKHDPPPVPFFTPLKARALSLKKLLPRWNIPREPESCCQLHTVLASIDEVLQYLCERPCEPLWSTWSGGQCARCKCMCSNPRGRCVVCGYEAGEPSNPAGVLR